MTEQRYAVIIGVDDAGHTADGTTAVLPRLRYAEADAKAIHAVLCDPRAGTFDLGDVRLFASAETTADRVKAAFMEVLGAADASDVLVVYFAGHTLSPDWSRATDSYLVTPELDQAALARNPDAGLRMTFLKRDVLDAFPGKALLILDCCRAGTVLTATGRDIDLVSVAGRDHARYTALMASAADDVAREDPALEHGVFTYHVLQAMRGDAADAQGDVTFQSLGSYLSSQDITPEPGYFTQNWGRGTVLTRPGLPGRHATRPVADYVRMTPLANPLDAAVPVIVRLIDRLVHGAKDSRSLVENLRLVLGAESAAVLEFTTSDVKRIDSTDGFDRDYVQDLLRAGGEPDQLGFGHHVTDDERLLLSVPLQRSPGKSVLLAVVNPPVELLGLGEPLARILQTAYRTDIAAAPGEAEIHMLTDLRKTFGRLPRAFFDRYRQLQRELLESYTMVFQPIVTIGKVARQVGVHSFEALTRRSVHDLSAPVGLLQTAHTWGDGLVVERDEIIAAKALAAFADAHDAGPWDTPKPVSVNVAVRSLLSDTYVMTLKHALDASGLNPDGVTLEISEQDPIKPRIDEQWSDEPHAYFHKRLVQIGRDLGVSFAVDDFGSDHASLSRMAELPLTQIKVDRTVLHHATALEELEFVAKIARHARDQGRTHSSRVVIVEGVDEHSPVSLRQLYDAHVRHIQGYITQQPAAPTLRQLSDDVREDIAARVRGDDEKRQTALARGDRSGRRSSIRRSA